MGNIIILYCKQGDGLAHTMQCVALAGPATLSFGSLSMACVSCCEFWMQAAESLYSKTGDSVTSVFAKV